jgi:hypothetical protein
MPEMERPNLELDDLLQRLESHLARHTWRSAGTMSNHVLTSVFEEVAQVDFSGLDAKIADLFYGILIRTGDQSNKEQMATIVRIGKLIGKP